MLKDRLISKISFAVVLQQSGFFRGNRYCMLSSLSLFDCVCSRAPECPGCVQVSPSLLEMAALCYGLRHEGGRVVVTALWIHFQECPFVWHATEQDLLECVTIVTVLCWICEREPFGRGGWRQRRPVCLSKCEGQGDGFQTCQLSANSQNLQSWISQVLCSEVEFYFPLSFTYIFKLLIKRLKWKHQ